MPCAPAPAMVRSRRHTAWGMPSPDPPDWRERGRRVTVGPPRYPLGYRSTSEESRMATIVSIDTPSLGDRSYLAHDGLVAMVVDPQRDIDRVLDLAREAGVTITHVFETHIHNDYVTGGLALAEATGAAYHV